MVAYSFKKRFVDPIRAGLGLFERMAPELIGIRPKRQTIRADRPRHARPGEILQLYCAMRTKQCFKIGEARCTEVHPITIMVKVKWGLDITIQNKLLNDQERLDFSRADGFENGVDMWDFWNEQHGQGEFKGVLIKWEPL